MFKWVYVSLLHEISMSPNGRREALEYVQRLTAIIIYILASHAVVCYTAVFSVVMQRSYGVNLWTKSSSRHLVVSTRRLVVSSRNLANVSC